MKITYPYEAEINTREEAYDYIKHLCNNCPRYASNWDCSGAQAAKCQKTVHEVVEAFKKPDYEQLEKEGRLIILPVPLGSTVYTVVQGCSCGPGGKPWYYITESEFTLDDYERFGDTIFATFKEANDKAKESRKQWKTKSNIFKCCFFVCHCYNNFSIRRMLWELIIQMKKW